jgi:hypothetical protein
MTAKDDLHILESCRAIRTHGALAKGEYPGGYYPAYVRDAADQVGIGTLCAAVVNACDAEWAHRLLCLCHVTSAQREALLEVIELDGTAADMWGILFTHQKRLSAWRFERFSRRLIMSADRTLIGCAMQYVPAFRMLLSSQPST